MFNWIRDRSILFYEYYYEITKTFWMMREINAISHTLEQEYINFITLWKIRKEKHITIIFKKKECYHKFYFLSRNFLIFPLEKHCQIYTSIPTLKIYKENKTKIN